MKTDSNINTSEEEDIEFRQLLSMKGNDLVRGNQADLVPPLDHLAGTSMYQCTPLHALNNDKSQHYFYEFDWCTSKLSQKNILLIKSMLLICYKNALWQTECITVHALLS